MHDQYYLEGSNISEELAFPSGKASKSEKPTNPGGNFFPPLILIILNHYFCLVRK